jgi:hypothetical protein
MGSSGPAEEYAQNLLSREVLSEVVQASPQTIGRLAVELGLHAEILSGMLDGGLSLGALVDSLLLHGNLPQLVDQPLGTGRLVLVERDEAWEVGDGASSDR